ncbi:hypothetical protein KI688_000059 [Linnemannia hyalina]|uniref:Uncharacterized protein n=1 Tax=Linnemannia hyalina TaxID=64524 RepID=A0A9P7Y3I1_9FUNG|nr:hypothetical protein KI688_000059 [Linnemannia hyalina]
MDHSRLSLSFTRLSVISRTLWNSYKAYGPIPLYINLPTIDDPAHDLTEKQLCYHNFLDVQNLELKLHRRFVLICLVSSPFLLTLSLEALPGAIDPKEDLWTARITLVQLYDGFFKQWLRTNRARLESNSLTTRDQDASDLLTEDEGDFFYHGI